MKHISHTPNYAPLVIHPQLHAINYTPPTIHTVPDTFLQFFIENFTLTSNLVLTSILKLESTKIYA